MTPPPQDPPPDDAPPRDPPTTTERGRRGEDLAAAHLLREGYEILERNYRIRQGEIDLIAREGDLLCFVEVRSRQNADLGHPLETIGWRKRQRLVRAARHYLATRGPADAFTRFDVISIVYEPELEIELHRGAFEVDGA